jgi:hypothetical protein
MTINQMSENKVQVLHEEIINAPIEEVFPLACPVLEYKWIPDWKCELVHCPAGQVEQGTVFNEIMSAPMLLDKVVGKTTWTAVYYSAEEHKVHYELRNRISLTMNKLEFDVLGPNRTRSRMDMTYEALTDEGRDIIRNRGGEKIAFMQSALASMLKYYCEQGELIPMMEVKKGGLKSTVFTKREKFKLALNGIAMKLMKDENRGRFLNGQPVSVIDPTR